MAAIDFLTDALSQAYSSSDLATAGAKPRPTAGLTAAADVGADLAPGRPLKVGADFAKPGGVAARQYAARLAAAAAAANIAPLKTAVGSKSLRFGAPLALAGGAVQSVLDSPESVADLAGSLGIDYESAAGKGGANLINFLRNVGRTTGAGIVGEGIANKIAGQPFFSGSNEFSVTPAGFDAAGAAAVAPILRGAKPVIPAALPAAASQLRAVPGATDASGAPSPVAPAAPAASPVYKITNADGSTSYTNVATDIVAAQNTGSKVLALGEQPTTPGVVTGQTGTMNIVPGVTPQQREQAISASIRDRQYALARGIANTPDQLANIDYQEQLQDQLREVRKAKSPQRIAASLAVAQRLMESQAAATAAQAQGRGATNAAYLKLVSDTLLAGPKNEQIAAETATIRAVRDQADADFKAGKITGPERAAILNKHALPQPNVIANPAAIFAPPGTVSPFASFSRGAQPGTIVENAQVRSVPVGTPFTLNGKKYISAPGGQHILVPGQ